PTVSHPVAEPRFEPRHGREVLGRPWIGGAPGKCRENGRQEVGQSERRFHTDGRANFAPNETGVIVPRGPQLDQPRIPREPANGRLLILQRENRRALPGTEPTEQRLVLRSEVAPDKSLDHAHHGKGSLLTEAQRS